MLASRLRNIRPRKAHIQLQCQIIRRLLSVELQQAGNAEGVKIDQTSDGVTCGTAVIAPFPEFLPVVRTHPCDMSLPATMSRARLDIELRLCMYGLQSIVGCLPGISPCHHLTFMLSFFAQIL